VITEWFIAFFSDLLDWFLEFFGDHEPPAWIGDAAVFVTDLFNSIAGLGAWVPFPVFGMVAAAVSVFGFVLFGVKGLRWLYGLTPFSGGS
jgi:hypothetical protein